MSVGKLFLFPLLIHLRCSAGGENLVVQECSLKLNEIEQESIIPLEPFREELAMGGKNIFFLETSDRNYLHPRETCAIESALNHAFHPSDEVTAFVLLTSKYLDLGANNATRQLYERFRDSRLLFRHIDKESVLDETPLEDLGRSKIIDDGEHHIVQWR